ncbi:MAG: CDP-alcohol phosphatidyltransferase family protein [Bacteroidota bacterium]
MSDAAPQPAPAQPAKAKKRVNETPLARFERWALPRMAARLPAWMTPDKLTLIGLASAVLIAASYLLTAYSLDWLWLATVGWVIHWWADSLDGTLARVRKIQRERYGFYVDHQSDAVSIFVIFAGLGFSPLMELPIALFIVIGYFLMMIMVNLVTIARDVFKISFGGFGPTESRLLMIGAGTVVWLLGNPTFEFLDRTWTLFDGFGGVAAVLLLCLYAGSSLIERGKLAKLDPPRQPTLPTEAAPPTPEAAEPEVA